MSRRPAPATAGCPQAISSTLDSTRHPGRIDASVHRPAADDTARPPLAPTRPLPLAGRGWVWGSAKYLPPSRTPTRHVAAKVNLRSDAPPSPQGGGFAAALASLNFDGQFLCRLAFASASGMPGERFRSRVSVALPAG